VSTSGRPRATVTVRYWAAAKAAAGVAEETASAATVGELLDQAAAGHGPDLARVLARSSILLDGRRARPEDPLVDGATVEVLPPFAGG